VARQVLSTIVIHSALLIPGVVRMANPVRSAQRYGQWSHLLKRELPPQGVSLTIKDNTVTADLYIVVESDADMLAVGSAVQEEVSAALEEMVGMQVEAVNVYIQDVA
jgi:uncharacterized alkaline shock family protein YloU